jgi:hypothetical protein
MLDAVPIPIKRTTNAMDFDRRSTILGLASLAAAPLLGPLPALAALTGFRPRGQGGVDHSAYDALLRTYVKPDAEGYNRVDYRGVKSQLGALRTYLTALQAVDPVSLSRDEAHAYWINLYNAKTLEVVAEAYPVTSIKKINLGGSFLFGSGPWKAKLMTVKGTDLSLDDVEHEIVRALFNDPMSHYGLNCASYSCPNLATRAYTGGNITGCSLRPGAIMSTIRAGSASVMAASPPPRFIPGMRATLAGRAGSRPTGPASHHPKRLH